MNPTYTSVFEISTRQTVTITDPPMDISTCFPNGHPIPVIWLSRRRIRSRACSTRLEAPPTFRLRVYDVDSHQMIASYKT